MKINSTSSIIFSIFFAFMQFTVASLAQNNSYRNNTIVLIDFSNSQNDEIIKNYIKLIEKIWQSSSKNDRLVVLPIDAGSLSQNSRIIDFDLQLNLPKQKPGRKGEAELRTALTQSLIQGTKMIEAKILSYKEERKAISRQTDILGALSAIESLLESKPPKADLLEQLSGKSEFEIRNNIVILSDMIHQTKGLDFSSLSLFAPKNKTLLTRFSQSEKPNLSSSNVFVHGATFQTPEGFVKIKTFWEDYFKNHNSILKAYNYDSESEIIRFFSFKN